MPILKVDKGLQPEQNGVSLMKPMPELDGLLARAVKAGIFGTKMRSVINLPSRTALPRSSASSSSSPPRSRRTG